MACFWRQIFQLSMRFEILLSTLGWQETMPAAKIELRWVVNVIKRELI